MKITGLSEIDRSYISGEKLRMIALFGLLLVIDCAFSFFRNSDYLTLTIWILFCTTIIIVDLKFFLKYVAYFFYYSTNVLAVFIIENYCFFLDELQTPTHRNDSLLLITLTHCIFMVTIYCIDSRIEKNMQESKLAVTEVKEVKATDNIIISVLWLVLILLSVYLFFKGYQNPASRLNLDRFRYKNQIMNGIWTIIDLYIINLVPIAVIIALKGKWKAALVPVLILSAYYVYTGHKFGIFLSIVLLFLPLFIERFHLYTIRKGLKRTIAFGAVFVAGITYVLFSFMKKTYGTNKGEFITYIFKRLSQQGQMWWAIYGYEKGGPIRFADLMRSSGALFKMNRAVLEAKDYGIYKLMKMVTPVEVYNRKIESGSRYAFSTDASFYYYFKETGLIILTIVFAILLTYITNWYWREILQKNWFGALVSGRFYLIILSTLLQSDFNVLFSRRNVALLILYLIIDHIGGRRKTVGSVDG